MSVFLLWSGGADVLRHGSLTSAPRDYTLLPSAVSCLMPSAVVDYCCMMAEESMVNEETAAGAAVT